MPSLDTFTAFVRATGVKVATGPDQIVNDAAKNTYFIARMLKGRDVDMSVQSGSSIVDRIQLSDSGTAEFFHPNDDLEIQNVDSLSSIEIDWRFIADHYTYTDQEVALNSGDPQTYYKNLLKSKRMACKTSTMNKMENALWAAPNNAGMETSSGKIPYSFPALVTPDGLAPSGFTNIHGLPPATNPNWQNQTATYDPSDLADPETGVVQAFDRMFHLVRFVAPRTAQEYFESDMLQKMTIATNLDGMLTYQRLTRDSNDRLTPANNLGWVAGNVVYSGIPLEYVSTLNDALVNGGAALTAGQPWYWWLNLNYIFPIFHTEKYMMETEPMTHPKQPFSRVVWTQTYYNIFCRSRKRQGLISAA